MAGLVTVVSRNRSLSVAIGGSRGFVASRRKQVPKQVRLQVRLASVETSVFSKFPSVFSKCLSVTSVQAVEGVECFGVH